MKTFLAFVLAAMLVSVARADDQGHSATIDAQWAVKLLHDAQDSGSPAAIAAAQREVVRTNRIMLNSILEGNDTPDDYR